MYKVFSNDQVITLTDSYEDYQSGFETLFIHYRSEQALFESIELLNSSAIVSGLCVYTEKLDDLWNTFCSKYKVIEAAGGIVKNDEKVLMILKNDHWDLPKGKIDGVESIEEAALREVSEECGLNDLSITGNLDNTYYLYRENSNVVLKKTSWFLMSSGTEGPLQGDESEGIVDVKWVKASEWKQLSEKSYISVINLLSSIF